MFQVIPNPYKRAFFKTPPTHLRALNFETRPNDSIEKAFLVAPKEQNMLVMHPNCVQHFGFLLRRRQDNSVLSQSRSTWTSTSHLFKKGHLWHSIEYCLVNGVLIMGEKQYWPKSWDSNGLQTVLWYQLTSQLIESCTHRVSRMTHLLLYLDDEAQWSQSH